MRTWVSMAGGLAIGHANGTVGDDYSMLKEGKVS